MKKQELPEFDAFISNLQPLLENYLLDNIMKPRMDNWKSLPYELRYLDTLARVFDVKLKNPCTSVVLLRGEKKQISIGIAFNTPSNPQTLADIKKMAELLQAAINDESYVSTFMMEALSKSQCYMHCIGKIQERLKAYEGVIIANPLIQETLDVAGTFVRFINTKVTKEVFKQYVVTLEKLSILLKANFTEDEVSATLRADIFDKKTLEMLIRPYQDIQKIISFSNKMGIKLVTYEVVNNVEGAHAELAASSYYFDKCGESPRYVGISKLSCYLCDELLTIENQPHRGGHGILYLKDYKLPNKYDSSAPLKEFLSSKLQEYLNKSLLLKPEEHILNTTLLNKASKIIQFLSYYDPYVEGNTKLSDLLQTLPPRGDLDQFDDLSSDEGYEEQLLGEIKHSFEAL